MLEMIPKIRPYLIATRATDGSSCMTWMNWLGIYSVGKLKNKKLPLSKGNDSQKSGLRGLSSEKK
jgi:hypothetical protein